jgi:hypothetical protein
MSGFLVGTSLLCDLGAPVFLMITNLGEVLRSGEKGAEGTGELIFNDRSEM